jgi:hypothetical protein
MISCKEVAKLLSSDQVSSLRWWKRAELRLHLAMCKHCSRFARQLQQLREAAKRAQDALEPDSHLEERIMARLSGRK